MKHFGDITKLSGYKLPVVDVITGGSPCQDLSVAGKRAGLAGERSGLFMEQIRIVKEMREHDKADGRTGFLVRPRYMVWENVPGAFSSGKPKGADFAAVIEEIIKVAEPGATVDVRVPDRGWSKSGCYYAEDGSWSIAWRVHDAQFWGVPQRRKRIALVADFGGLSAPEILFERNGLSRDIEESGEAGETVAGTVERSIDKTISFQERAGKPGGGKGILIQHERTGALSTLNNQSVVYGICSTNSNSMKSSNPHSGIYKANTSRTLDLNGGSPACNQGGMAVLDNRCWSLDEKMGQTYVHNDMGNTLGARDYKQPQAVFASVQTFSLQAIGAYKESDQASSLKMRDYKDATDLIAAVDCRNGTENQDINGTLQAKEQGQNLNSNNVCRVGSVVRRLTPLECERLQGFLGGWTDIGEWTDSKGKRHKEADSPRYKALGNSIALPFWQWMARRICAQYERTPTMASLFDGIGGFPLVFERCGAKAVWASEIEEFPIAVTKRHFPQDEST